MYLSCASAHAGRACTARRPASRTSQRCVARVQGPRLKKSDFPGGRATPIHVPDSDTRRTGDSHAAASPSTRTRRTRHSETADTGRRADSTTALSGTVLARSRRSSHWHSGLLAAGGSRARRGTRKTLLALKHSHVTRSPQHTTRTLRPDARLARQARPSVLALSRAHAWVRVRVRVRDRLRVPT